MGNTRHFCDNSAHLFNSCRFPNFPFCTKKPAAFIFHSAMKMPFPFYFCAQGCQNVTVLKKLGTSVSLFAVSLFTYLSESATTWVFAGHLCSTFPSSFPELTRPKQVSRSETKKFLAWLTSFCFCSLHSTSAENFPRTVTQKIHCNTNLWNKTAERNCHVFQKKKVRYNFTYFTRVLWWKVERQEMI